ncbi:ANTAR domain-containing protein [Waltera sp.]|uniref:ANTAR domain-containing protein n=1 Tax=Waltera sp. TaxID=2815806 RepID=UPI0039A2D903
MQRMKKAIKDAKELLMARNHMTEEEAHRYLRRPVWTVVPIWWRRHRWYCP